MAHFYGTVQGSGGDVSRCGTKKSGYNSCAASWEGAVQVNLYYNEEHDEDWAEVYLNKWNGAGKQITLYRGPVSGRDFEHFKK